MQSHVAVVGDLHGNWQAALNKMRRLGIITFPGKDIPKDASTLLAPTLDSIGRNDDWYVVQVGDFINMGPWPNMHPLYKYRNDLQMLKYYPLFDKILVGNHEAYYTHNLDAGRFRGMAHSGSELEPGTIDYIKDMLGEGHYTGATVLVAGHMPWLVTHAGLHPAFDPVALAKEFDPGTEMVDVDIYWNCAKQINSDFWNLVWRVKDTVDHITRIGKESGGMAPYGGILWLRPGECKTKYYHNPGEYFVPNQIVGHTPRNEHPRYVPIRKTWYIDNDNAGMIVSHHGGPWEVA